MRTIGTGLVLGVALLVTAGTASAAERVAAKLVGQAVMPALTMLPPPIDAPLLFQTSAKFAGPGNTRIDLPNSVDATTEAGGQVRPTGLAFPLVGQAIQGFSGIRSLGDGRFLTLTDNGFGTKANSADSLLMFHLLEADWQEGRLKRTNTVFVRDPDKVVPFRIVTETTAERYLTGADFDPESIQPVGDHYWIGEEFGPYLLEVDAEGKVMAMVDTTVDDKVVQSPDNPAISTPRSPGLVSFAVKRSKGFEGMALSPDAETLYPLLEGPLLNERGEPEKVAGKEALRILEFDVGKRAWTGKSWLYPLDEDGHAIGDFNMIDATRGLVIERDNFEGDPKDTCQGEVRADCIAKPAAFKRIYLVELGEPGQAVRKIAYLDLMDIDDPDGVARLGGGEGKFDFPFFTIEDVDMVDPRHIVVGNDNNLPFSAGRKVDQADADELILLDIGDFLQMR